MLELRAIAAARRREHELALFTAWHVEAFARHERLPALASCLARLRAAGRDGDVDAQSPEEQIAAVRAALGASA